MEQKYYYATKEHAAKVCLDMYANLTEMQAAELSAITRRSKSEKWADLRKIFKN